MADGEPVILDTTLKPSEPLAPSALKAVLAAVVVVNFGFASLLAARGAWPVMPFMGIDIALLAWAFRTSVRAAERRERITLTPSRLTVARRPPHGPTSEIAFNPYWVRVDMAEPPDHWSRLRLRSHGRAVEIGAFLAPAERVSLAESLKQALRRARETPL